MQHEDLRIRPQERPLQAGLTPAQFQPAICRASEESLLAYSYRNLLDTLSARRRLEAANTSPDTI